MITALTFMIFHSKSNCSSNILKVSKSYLNNKNNNSNNKNNNSNFNNNNNSKSSRI